MQGPPIFALYNFVGFQLWKPTIFQLTVLEFLISYNERQIETAALMHWYGQIWPFHNAFWMITLITT